MIYKLALPRRRLLTALVDVGGTMERESLIDLVAVRRASSYKMLHNLIAEGYVDSYLADAATVTPVDSDRAIWCRITDAGRQALLVPVPVFRQPHSWQRPGAAGVGSDDDLAFGTNEAAP